MIAKLFHGDHVTIINSGNGYVSLAATLIAITEHASINNLVFIGLTLINMLNDA